MIGQFPASATLNIHAFTTVFGILGGGTYLVVRGLMSYGPGGWLPIAPALLVGVFEWFGWFGISPP